MSDRHAPPDEAIESARERARDVALGSTVPEALEQAYERLPPHQVECWRAFEETFGALVRGEAQRHGAWIAVLRGEIKSSVADPEKLFLSPDKHEVRQFEAQVEGWKTELDPLAVWRHQQGLLFRGKYPFFHLHQLLCIDPAAWCAEIDALPELDLMIVALFRYTHLKYNPTLLADLLRIAPRVFEEDGRWVSSRSVVALLLTHHALRIDSSEAWLRDTFQILLERPDGKYLTFAFLGYLAHKELRFGGQHDEPERRAFKILAEILATKFCVKDARDAWKAAEDVAKAKHEREKARRVLKENDGLQRIPDDRGEGARTLHGQGLPLLFGAAVMLGENPTEVEAEAFWSWFEELLVGRDKGLSLPRHDNGSTELLRRFGALLARLPDPEKAFRSTYRKLEPQRRRATFSHHYEGPNDDISSMLLLDIGPYAALYWRNRDANAGADSLFWCGYEAARRLWLTSLQRFSQETRRLVCYFFAFMPHLFGDKLQEALQRALPPIANDPGMVCSAGSLLFRNGIAPERLVPLMRGAGVDLERALRDAYQWATLTQNESIPRSIQTQNEDFPPAFEELVRALGMALSIEEIEERGEGKSSNEPALTRQRRAFALGIAWGSKLLQRLDEERCTPQRIVPLDAKGASWLLQVTLPPRMSDGFGLSPELRILVAHGDVREHDLRRAMQEPEGDMNIDPDLLVVAGDQPEFARQLSGLAGPWGQRIPWSLAEDEYVYLTSALREHLPTFDVFDRRDPVRGRALIGRQAEIADLAMRILRGEAIGIIGLRKVGKSSLLRALADQIDPIGARGVPLPSAEPEALVVSLDVQSFAEVELRVLLERLSERFDERLALLGIKRPEQTKEPEVEEDLHEDPLDTLRDLLKLSLEKTSLPVCFILDEYDLLFEGCDAGEPGIPGAERLLAWIRAEAQATGRVSLVLIGRDPVFLERPLLGGFTNPLAGWARPVFLGPLAREESDDLLVRLGKRVGLDVGPETRESAWQWTGGHPLLLRQYGAALYELAHAPPTHPGQVLTDPIHQDAAKLFLRRDAVQTICSEVRALLDARFPEALALLEALADAPPERVGIVIDQHGGPRAFGIATLCRFGIVHGTPAAPRLAGVYRAEFAMSRPGIDRSPAR